MKKHFILNIAFSLMLLPQFIGADCCNGLNTCCSTESKGIHIQKELLYWTTSEDGLAYTNKHSDVLTTTDFTQTDLIHPDFHWEYGFRLQTGYTLSYAPWTFQLSWTYLASKATGSRDLNSGPPDFQGIFPVWSMSPDTLAGDYVSTAHSRWHLHSNIIDFEALYHICWGERLLITPVIGIRGAILNQKLHVKYTGGTFFNGTDDNIMRNRFSGVGPRAGLALDYYLMCGFGLYGMVAATPMYGHYRISQRENYLDARRFLESKEENRFAFSYDYRIGLKWEGLVIESWPCLSLMLSWEGIEFFNQNRLARGSFDFFKRDRNLTLEGWTLSATINF